MIRELLRFICIVAIITLTVTTGVAMCRLLIYIIISVKDERFILPFKEILYVSLKAGLIGGAIGGVGIWFIYRFNLHQHR